MRRAAAAAAAALAVLCCASEGVRGAVEEVELTVHSSAGTWPVDLHMVAFGDDDPAAEVFLMLHGFPEGWVIWRDLALEVASLFADGDGTAAVRVVIPDQRGYNRSSIPEEVAAYDIEWLVQDVMAVADEVSPAKPVHLVAHDWGGPVAFGFAAAHPGRVATLTTLNGPHGQVFDASIRGAAADQQCRSDYIHFFLGDGTAQAMLADDCRRLAGWFGGVQGFDRGQYCDAWSQGCDAGTCSIQAGINWYRANLDLGGAEGSFACMREHLGAQPAAVAAPTLALWTLADTAFSNDVQLQGICRHVVSSEEAGERVNSSPFVVVPYTDVDHFGVISRPGVAQAIFDFVRGWGTDAWDGPANVAAANPAALVVAACENGEPCPAAACDAVAFGGEEEACEPDAGPCEGPGGDGDSPPTPNPDDTATSWEEHSEDGGGDGDSAWDSAAAAPFAAGALAAGLVVATALARAA